MSEEYAPGLWRPSVPLPYYGLLNVRCECGKRFWGRVELRGKPGRRYEEHYRAAHMPAGREATS